MVEVACRSHVRRGFFDVHASNASPIAKHALDKIGALFDIERTITGHATEIRRSVQQRAAQPRLDQLATWLDAQLTLIPPKATLPLPSGMRVRGGTPSRVISTMVDLRSATTQPRTRSGQWRLEGKTGSSRAAMQAANAPRPSTRSSARRNSTPSNRKPTCARCSPASAATRSTASTNCCPGTSRHQRRTASLPGAALSIGMVRSRQRTRSLSCVRTLVAQIDPLSSGFGFAGARREHVDRRIVGVDRRVRPSHARRSGRREGAPATTHVRAIRRAACDRGRRRDARRSQSGDRAAGDRRTWP